MSVINLDLGSNSYQVVYPDDLIKEISKTLSEYKGKKICLVTDENVSKLYSNMVMPLIENIASKTYTYQFKLGENHKTISYVTELLSELLERNWNRDDLIVVLGGGIVGDMGAFAASILVRGIKFIQIPTTLLSQVDSSVGGKTGVNHSVGKNLIGTFYQPKRVVVSSNFLKTLPIKEIQTGFAEVVKYGVIWDKELFAYLEDWFKKNNIEDFESYPEDFWERIIMTSIEIKAQVVERDEKEASLRMILNYGHTFGHAIEKLTGYKLYNHGEAVALGMLMAGYLAYKIEGASKDTYERQVHLLQKIGLPTKPDKSVKLIDIIEVMKVDKKVRDNKITLILPESIGEVRIERELSGKQIFEALEDVYG